LPQSKGRHGAALDLLRMLCLSPEELRRPPAGAAAELRGMPGVWAAVRYITALDPADPDLVSSHAE
jgi:hypothetical protein